MTDEVLKTITELEKDITYFKNLGFDMLAEKFSRDLNTIKILTETKN